MKNFLENKKGITLIALVVTIIILLIIAGITIAQLTGSGLFEKTKLAKEQSQMKTAEETMNLKITTIQIASYSEKKEIPTLQYLADKLCEDDEIAYVHLTATEKISAINEKITLGETNNSIFTKLEKYPYEFEINSALQLAKIDGIEVAKTKGTLQITENGEYDVTNYSKVNVNVEPTPEPSYPLISSIAPASYGKSINYSVTVGEGANAITLNDWKVFLNDGSNVYIILSDYLPVGAVPSSPGFTTSGTYVVNGTSSWNNTGFVSKLTTINNWTAIAAGVRNAIATGGPTYEQFAASWNANPSTKQRQITPLTVYLAANGLLDDTGLYIRPGSSDCNGYWLASIYSGNDYDVFTVYGNGAVANRTINRGCKWYTSHCLFAI